jgi:hypothetical protein
MINKKFPWIAIGILLIAFGLAGKEAHSQSASTAQGASGALVTSGSAPAVSSCGTSPTIRGNNFGGLVTIGSAPGTTCVLTFAPAFLSAPACVMVNQTTAGAAHKDTTTLTTLTLTGSPGLNAADVWAYICVQVP